MFSLTCRPPPSFRPTVRRHALSVTAAVVGDTRRGGGVCGERAAALTGGVRGDRGHRSLDTHLARARSLARPSHGATAAAAQASTPVGPSRPGR